VDGNGERSDAVVGVVECVGVVCRCVDDDRFVRESFDSDEAVPELSIFHTITFWFDCI
jgi:hypothetical protein